MSFSAYTSMRHLRFADPITPINPSIPKLEATDAASDLIGAFADFDKISNASFKSRLDSKAALRHKFRLNAV